MSIVETELALLRHPRLSPLATSAWPAWLWSADGSQILWANAAGAALFGAATAAACTECRFTVTEPSAAQIVRLAATLPSGGNERLERLRGFVGFGRVLTCACSRIVADGKSAVLVAAAESAGTAMTLAERVRRLFADGDAAVAAYAPDGALIFASAAAQKLLAGSATRAALGIETLAATAIETGSATGSGQAGGTSFDVAAIRLGQDASRVLMLILKEQTCGAADEQSAPQLDDAPQQAAAVAKEPEITLPAPPAEPAPAPQQANAPEEPVTERRHPLRFVWHMDADGRFGVGSDEFIELIGPRTVAAFGRLWSEIAADLKLDPDNQVSRAVASHETWSGIVVSWPVDDLNDRLPIELSGLPVFDRDRSFRGYRGFGVCRDINRINELARTRREHAVAETMPLQAADETPLAPVPEKSSAAPAAETAGASSPDRPAPSAAPASANVVQFRPTPPAEPKSPPTLSPVERKAFRELAQELTSRLRGSQAPAAEESDAEGAPAEAPGVAEAAPAAAEAVIEQVLLDRIPIGVLVYRHDSLLYANRHFLEWSGYTNLGAIEAAGGVSALFADPGADALAENGGSQSLSILTERGDKLPVEGRMFTVPWNGSSAIALILTNGQAATARRTAERALDAVEHENRELKSILDTASDGVVTLDPQGRIVTANTRAVSLFVRTTRDLAGSDFGELFAPDSERAARDFFDRIVQGAGTLNNVLDISARAGEDRFIPLSMTLARVGADRICAVFRDATARKQTEEELRNAKREATRAAAAKAEFLAKVSHEIRTPLNAMTGFAEVIMAERFGPIGNERYREYVKDIHGAGTHLVSMLNDLLDLSKIETGQIELTFANVNLNDLTQQCVGIMQQQANRARIIIRTSLTPGLARVVADERSLRQIVLNLLSNAIRFTGPGGQVIVSTVFTDSREAVLRVRDTGAGMNEKDIQTALEPFQQTATSGSWGSGGTGFGLPLTKALAEANRANFSIKSAPNAGTLIEIAFPPSRIVAD